MTSIEIWIPLALPPNESICEKSKEEDGLLTIAILPTKGSP
jgi:hypothetical protein